MARVEQTFPKLAAQRTFVQWHVEGSNKNKRQRTDALANEDVMSIIVCSLKVDHTKLAEIINWLRESNVYDGRLPAGFDSKKKSWGSSARANFWADGTKVCIQGQDKGNGITQLTMYFSPIVSSYATLCKLTFA